MTQAEIRDAFADGWVVRSNRAGALRDQVSAFYALAWLATIERQGRDR